MTDAIIEAYGPTLEEVFIASAKALVNTMLDIDKIQEQEQINIEATGDDLEGLLYNWLENVLLKILIDNIAPSDFRILNLIVNDNLKSNTLKNSNNNHTQINNNNNSKIPSSKFLIKATARGEKLDLVKHRYKVEVKGVTYHEMKIENENGKYFARFLIDL